MTHSKLYCMYCEQDSSQVPLIMVTFQGKDLRICPQHLPVLIHSPAKLADKLPGLAQLSPAEHHHHE
jgi:hypothetical protein